MNHYLTTFEIDVWVALNDIQRRHAFKALNGYYVGKENIHEDIHIPQELRDAAYAVEGATSVKLTVGLKPDGTLEVIND